MVKSDAYKYVAWCERCRKRAWKSKKDAKRARQVEAEPQLRAYRCPAWRPWWHLGHNPQAVRYGVKTAPEVYKRRRFDAAS